VARGELLVIIDDDMEPVPEFLSAHRDQHADGQRLAIVGAVPVQCDTSASPVSRYIARKFDEHLTRLAEPGRQLKLRDFYSGNFSIRREVLAEVGAFDDSFRVYGNEDLELAARLMRASVALKYAPAAMAYQRYTKDYVELALDNMSKGHTAVLLARKHPDVVPELRLGQERRCPWRQRMARDGLLRLTHVVPGIAQGVLRGGRWLERNRPDWLPGYCEVTLDYFFWLGARRERAGARA
jgi:hypothetical protein